MERKKEWYDNPNMITGLLIVLIFLIIIITQSFAVHNNVSSSEMLKSVLNHNSGYLIFFIYFIFLRTKLGKRYFNMMNLLLIIFQVIKAFTSIISVIQFFNFGNVFSVLMNIVLLLYMVKVFLDNLPIFKKYKLNQLKVDTVSNNNYFYIICGLSFVILCIELFRSLAFDHVAMSLFQTVFYIGFARYLYLYQLHKETAHLKKGKINNKIDTVDDIAKKGKKDEK